MALIDYQKGRFYGLGSYDERTIFKSAGFWYSKIRKAWITDRRDVAEAIQGIYWTDRARAFVAQQAALADTSYQMSYAKESGFTPLVPDKLHPRTGKPLAFFPYQAAAIEYALPRKDCLLADAPGIGKTPTAIGVFNCDPTVKIVLVVCPASLKEHWRREFELWKARPVTVAIAEASYDEKVQDGFYKNGKPKFKTVTQKDVWPGTDVVIINYEILDRFRDEIKSRAWDMLICDECHALKTSESGRTLFVLGGRRKEIVEDENTGKKRKEWKWYNAIDASRRLFLSGTPILNRPYELWPIVHAFDPEGLGRNEEEFCYRYCAAFHDSSRGPFGALDKSGASNEEELGRMLRERMMIRRLKKDVLPELPQKSRHIILIDTPETRKWVAREDEIAQALKLYETSTLRAGMNEFELEQAKGDQIVHAAAALDLREAFEDDGKFEARAMKLDYAAAVLGLEPPYVAVLFEELAQVRRELGIAKLSGVVPWVKDFLNGSEEKLLLFAYHTDVIEALREKLKDYNPAVIYGKVPVNRRQLEVDKFQDDESCRGGIMQIDCAGVGFTMTRAWNVAFTEEDWGPKKKEQAEDRVCRIGQTAEKIMSFSLVVNGSLDCRIAQCSFFKDEVINKVMDT